MDYSILGSILGSPYFGKLPYQEYECGVVRVLVRCDHCPEAHEAGEWGDGCFQSLRVSIIHR